MATPAMIGIRRDDGRVLASYCHFDGHTDSLGATLKQFYNISGMALLLISGGDMTSVGSRVFSTKGSGHSFDTPEKGVTVYYFRDRGEKDSGPKVFENENEYAECRQVYIYLFKNEKWHVYTKNGWEEF